MLHGMFRCCSAAANATPPMPPPIIAQVKPWNVSASLPSQVLPPSSPADIAIRPDASQALQGFIGILGITSPSCFSCLARLLARAFFERFARTFDSPLHLWHI